MKVTKKLFLFGVAASLVAVAAFVVPLTAKEAIGQSDGKEVTVTGRVVDLHCFMTGRYPSEDRPKCTADCIRAGVPAAVETSTGLILLGQAAKGVAPTLAPLAFEEVEIKGKLFEKAGLKYLDIASAAKAKLQPVDLPDWPEEEEDDDMED